MGLGKTVQTLAFLAWVNEQDDMASQRKPHLIVAPTGLLRNWEAEAQIHLSEDGLGRLQRAYGTGLKELSQLGAWSGHAGSGPGLLGAGHLSTSGTGNLVDGPGRRR